MAEPAGGTGPGPKLGLFLDLRNPPQWSRPPAQRYAWSLELVTGAEALGIGSAWCTEHHFFEDGYLPQPLVFCAALAARTRSIRVGTAVTLGPFRNPLHLAEEAAVADLISGGRLELGIGAGYVPAEFAAFGAERERRFAATDAVAAEVARLFATTGVSPAPVQRPFPIWLGYQGPGGARRAGRLGTGLLSLSPASLGPYRQGLAEGGHPEEAARMAGVVDLIVADDPEAAADAIAPHYAYQRWTYQRVHGQPGAAAPPPPDADAIRRTMREVEGLGLQGLIVCTPDEAVSVLERRLSGLPAHHVYLWATVAGMPDPLAERHVELLCGAVAPALTAALSAPGAPVGGPTPPAGG